MDLFFSLSGLMLTGFRLVVGAIVAAASPTAPPQPDVTPPAVERPAETSPESQPTDYDNWL